MGKNTKNKKTPRTARKRPYFRKSSNKMAQDLFSPITVRKCDYVHIKIRFETLLRAKAKTRQDLEYFTGFSRSHVAAMCNGKLIPPPDTRIKVAKFFKVDSLTIWGVPGMEYSSVKVQYPSIKNKLKGGPLSDLSPKN